MPHRRSVHESTTGHRPRWSSTYPRSTPSTWPAGSPWPTPSSPPAATPTIRVVVLRAEGRGFYAGVDIKEIQAKGDEALVGVNRGCAAAFAAVYDCEVPVIAAVHGFCLGGGIGLVGNADIIVASDDATFGLPEVDRGALGAATHLARLVPQHRMRQMVYTASPATAAELHELGSVPAVVPPERLVDPAYEVAGRHRRQEPDHHPPGQGVPQRHRPRRRQAQLPLRAGLHLRAPRLAAWPTSSAPPSWRSATPNVSTVMSAMADKRVTRRRDGGRAPAGHDRRLRRLGIPAQAHGGGPGHRPGRTSVISPSSPTAGPTSGSSAPPGRCAKSSTASSPSTPSPSIPTSAPPARTGAVEAMEVDEGMFYLGLLAASRRVPFLPTRAGLGSDVMRVNPELRTVTSPYGHHLPDAEELVAMPALTLDAAFVHLNRADSHGNGQSSDRTPSSTALPGAAARRFVTAERSSPPGALLDEGPIQPSPSAGSSPMPWPRSPGAPTSPPVPPTTTATGPFQKPYAGRGPTPTPGRPSPSATSWWTSPVTRRPWPSVGSGPVMSDGGVEVTRAEVVAVACAEAWRGDGEIVASPFGTIPAIGARLARLTFEPDLVLTDGEAALMANTPSVSAPFRARPRGVAALPAGLRRGLVGPTSRHDDGHPGRPLRQPEHLASATGPARRPS